MSDKRYDRYDTDGDSATIVSEDATVENLQGNVKRNLNKEYEEIFGGELSDVDDTCSVCDQFDIEITSSYPSIDVSDYFGFKTINESVIKALYYKLLEYRLYETMAILIKHNKLKFEQFEIPIVVQDMIKRGDVKDLKHVRNVFHKEVEQRQKWAK
ncbi:20930_t:CDS:2 [Gigaspora margarita]|uniref:20930_t:CDS:1 n=1 Tax=Gigaspora margarita TaxID=4874 RepID=A0ABN7V3N6_GIGMA|nr:20930_t:CDS:2 [Gigaspora margarita]